MPIRAPCPAATIVESLARHRYGINEYMVPPSYTYTR
jgi:hypothetical protein